MDFLLENAFIYLIQQWTHNTLLDQVYQVWAGSQLLQPISPPSFFQARSIHLTFIDKASLAGLSISRAKKEGTKGVLGSSQCDG